MENLPLTPEGNPKASAAISRFSLWGLLGTSAATVVLVCEYDGLGSHVSPSVVTLSILLLLLSLILGVVQKWVSMMGTTRFKGMLHHPQGARGLKKDTLELAETDFLRLLDIQLLVTAFQSALILCALLLFSLGFFITTYAA